MQYGESIVEKTTAKTIAAGIPCLFNKASGNSDHLKINALMIYLQFHLRNSRSVESARRILQTVLVYRDKESSRIENSDSGALEIAELIGLEFSSYSISINDEVQNIISALEKVRHRLSDVAKSRSKRNIPDLLNIIEEDRLNKRSCLDSSVNDLMVSLISAFDPERLLNSIDEDEASREWLKKNALYKELKNRYENIEKYRENGKFLRDFWIMNKQNSKL